MASKLNPYLSFNGNARQAMEFYKTVFGGELRMNTFGEYGAADGPSANNIMHAQLETPNGFTLMASDTMPDMPYQPGNNMTVSLSGDNGKELHAYWDKLSKSGQVTMPWRSRCGATSSACAQTSSVSRGWSTSSRRRAERDRPAGLACLL